VTLTVSGAFSATVAVGGAVTAGTRSRFVTVTWVVAVSASAFEAKNVMT
jgi:hypothetical protein